MTELSRRQFAGLEMAARNPSILSFWQIAGDLCISSPLFIGIVVLILLQFAKSSTDQKGK